MNELTQDTLISLELVRIINLWRKDGQAKLRHSDFLEKIRKRFPDTHEKFLGTYLDYQREKRPCYRLPRHECFLMVMFESQEVYEALDDRWAELEDDTEPESKVERLRRELREAEERLRIEEERICLEEENSKLKEENSKLKTLLGLQS